MAVYGLLVGVNRYQNQMIRPLQGCESDVYLFSQTLQKRFNVNESNLKILTNAAATHQNIIDSFQHHLIDRDWKKYDTAVFYFSGHGAQTAAPEIFWDIEPDHLNESMVCHDSRTPGVPDLLDKELRYLIAKLAAKCDNIAIFLDCCHGGHGTRFIGEAPEEVRLAPVDMTTYPLESFVFGQQAANRTLDKTQLKQLIPDSGKHILLSGCQDFQLSVEKAQGPAFQRHGLFTYAMCETLSSLQYPVSYQELRNRIYQRVQSQASTQSPQIEAVAGADINQAALGGELLPVRMLVFKENGQWKLNAGVMHGLNIGDEVALFGNDADPTQQTNNLTTARIQQADSFKSTLEINDAGKLNGKEYTATISRQHFPKMPVRLVGDDADVQAARTLLEQDASANAPGTFLLATEQEPRYEIHLSNGSCYVTKPRDSRPLFKKTQNIVEALEQAAVMARWQQKLDLSNLETRLNDPVEIVITYKGEEYLNQDVTLSYTFDGSKWEKPRFNLELRLKPGQPRLYYALLYFDGSTGEISNVLASGGWLGHEGVEQEGQIKAQPVVKAFEGKAIPLKIRDELLAQGVTRIQDSLKLMLCEEEFDSSLLNQQALQLEESKSTRTLLRNSLERFIQEAHTRSLAVEDEEKVSSPDWTSKVVNISVIRPLESTAVPEHQAEVLVQNDENDVRIEPHPAFRGLVRLTTSHQVNTRGLTDSKAPEPAVLGADASTFMLSGGRGPDLGLDTLEVYLTDETDSVTPANPLTLSINQTLASGEQIIPYAFDSENGFFLPLGRATAGDDGRTHIHIEELPESAAALPTDSTRSIGSALKIYFRKLVYRDLLRIDEEIHFLRIPVFSETNPLEVSDYIADTATIAEQVASAKRILLIIHGIIGHTNTIAGCVNMVTGEDQLPLSAQYDLILTFDYENLNTRIQDIALSLQQQLTAAGISAESGKHVDILAHSIGGLVSRWFIEREGGDAVVNQLVMVGTPNGGSPLATVKEQGYAILKTWAYGNLAIILNGLTTAYVGGMAVAGLMKLLDAVDNNLDQMAPDSDLIQDLLNSPAPQNTRYAVIAGDTSGLMIPSDQYTERLSKLLGYLGKRLKLAAYDLLTEKLFKEANDIAVGQSSMKQFNPEWQDAVTVENVQCDHLSYFAEKVTVQKITQQLSG
ncbi:MAG: caspase family protein [Gammaproteobacteria bacterium]|nr:caspase family protein [Gammaproteobacteria bacterium]MBU1722925.1 caspase family protein [Gammaproteobacteria bacterium]MBU2005698.1 caspase family protein [Gammaproteobacteria bacterium]